MKAVDVECSVCKASIDEACDLDFGTGFEPTVGKFHQARVTAAGREERTRNLAARALARRKVTP